MFVQLTVLQGKVILKGDRSYRCWIDEDELRELPEFSGEDSFELLYNIKSYFSELYRERDSRFQSFKIVEIEWKLIGREKRLYRVLNEISKPFIQLGGKQLPLSTEKAVAIDNLLGGLNSYHDRKNYLLYSVGELSEVLESDFRVFSSHIDIINRFNRHFDSSEVDEVYQRDGDKLSGPLDNTVTNAVLIDAILSSSRDILDNTIFLFTFGEEDISEDGSWGIKSFIEFLEEREALQSAFFYNLDVTNLNSGGDISIEASENIEELEEKFSEIERLKISKYRDDDDLLYVLNSNGRGYSVCLPTDGEIHSLINSTTLQQIEGYSDFIKRLLTSSF